MRYTVRPLLARLMWPRLLRKLFALHLRRKNSGAFYVPWFSHPVLSGPPRSRR
jgi:hypothetical protein